MAKESPQEKQWPSVHVAYDLVLPSYEWLLRRLESTEQRLQWLMTYLATLTVAVPIIARATADDLPHVNNWAFAALACFALATVIGVAARWWGGPKFPNLRARTQELHQDTWAYRKDALYHAADQLEENTKTVRYKAMAADVMSALLVSEAICGVMWIVL